MRKLFGRKSEPELPLAINDFSSEHSRASHDTKLSKSSRVQAKLGLRAIESTYNDSFDAEFSMIAIHGSGGDVDISWTNRESGWCWIRDIWDYLPIQTWTFGYDSKSKLTPAEHADWLLDAIIQQNLYRGPIIFLAKDFGGLILSQALFLASTKFKPNYKEVLEKTVGVLFFNTPHNGSVACQRMSFASRLVPNMPRKHWEHLAKGNDIEVFRYLRKPSVKRKIVSVHSNQDLPFSSKTLFSREEVTIDDEEVITTDAPIGDVGKFIDSQDPNFRRVLHVLEKWVARYRKRVEEDQVLSLSATDLGTYATTVVQNSSLTEPPTKNVEHVSWTDPATTSSMSTGQQVYIHKDSDSEFESTQSLQLNPEFLANLGLHKLSFNREISPKIDIVAVHSVKGHHIFSWQAKTNNSEKVWIRDFLEDEIPEARVFSFGWNAGLFENSRADLRDVATQLLVRLDTIRSSDEEKVRPLLFLGHGIGGILIKQALILAGADRQYQSIFASTKAVFFFGTPHRGIDPEQYTQALMQRGSAVDTHHAFINALSRNSDTIQDLSFKFRHLTDSIRIVSFYELFASSLTHDDRVVSRADAIMDAARERQIPVDATHETICKFESQKDPNFRTVVSEILALAESTYG